METQAASGPAVRPPAVTAGAISLGPGLRSAWPPHPSERCTDREHLPLTVHRTNGSYGA
jgi:hypothetical protein